MEIELDESTDSHVLPEIPPTPPVGVHFPDVLDLLLPAFGIREKVKIFLHEDTLLLYRRDYLSGSTASSLDNKEVEEIEFEFEIGENEGLGVTILGEQPVRVSRIFSNSPADNYNMQTDDLITAVNGNNVSRLEHERVAHILKNLAGAVSITVQRTKQIQRGEQPDLIPSGWKIYKMIPLLHATVSLYKPGSALRIENGFCIRDVSGSEEATLQCDGRESAELLLCVLSLKRAIQRQQQPHLDQLNRLLPPANVVMAMGWMFEMVRQSPNQTYWVRRFVVCTRSQVRLFTAPPSNGHDWERCDARYDLMTLSCHILKEKKPLRSNSFLLSSGMGSEHILSPETWDDLVSWIHSLNSAVVALIMQDSFVRFPGVFENRNILLELNFPLSCVRAINPKTDNLIHSWPLSAISHTEEAANSFLVIHFEPSPDKPDRIRVQLQSVQSVLHALKSFIRARIGESDPAYARSFTLRSF